MGGLVIGEQSFDRGTNSEGGTMTGGRSRNVFEEIKNALGGHPFELEWR